MTTFKTFAIAAMMTVFGATTTFAAKNNKYNNNHNHNAKVEVTNHRVGATATSNNHITLQEYQAAKRCNCKTCKAIVKNYEKQIKQHNNRNNQCNCQNCLNASTKTTAKGNTHKANNQIIDGRR